MKSPVMLAVACLVCSAASAHAQLGGLRLLTATGLKDQLGTAEGEGEQNNPPRSPKGRGGTALGRVNPP